MGNTEDALSKIQAKLDQFDWKDIYNINKIELFYRL